MHGAAIAFMAAPREERSASMGVDEMILSRDRILTTHVGSLPRNERLSDLLMAQEEGKPYDAKVLAEQSRELRVRDTTETASARRRFYPDPPAAAAPRDRSQCARRCRSRA